MVEPHAFRSTASPQPGDASPLELQPALTRARRLFEAARIGPRWSARARFALFDLDFGVGLGFFTCLAAWRAASDPPRRLDYVAIAPVLPPAAVLRAVIEATGLSNTSDAAALGAQWPMALPGMHTLTCADGAVSLVLCLADLETALGRVRCAADAFVLDAHGGAAGGGTVSFFGPSALGSAGALRRLGRFARPGATLAFCAPASGAPLALGRAVPDLEHAGFRIQIAPNGGGGAPAPVGQAGVLAGRGVSGGSASSASSAGTQGTDDTDDPRGMLLLTGTHAPAWTTYPPPAPDPVWPLRRALVVGAGVAGCAIASALARRGWDVAVHERASAVCAEGSAQPRVADHLHLSPDDNHLARLTRAALMCALRDSGRAPADAEFVDGVGVGGHGAGIAGPDSAAVTGRLALAEHAQAFESQRAMLDRLALPRAYAQLLDAAQASELAGVRLRTGGIWLPLCRSVDPVRQCREWLGAQAARIAVHHGVPVARIARHDGFWTLYDERGAALDAAPVLVLAAAGSVPGLAGLQGVTLRRVRGQTTRLGPAALPGLRVVLGADAYACPLPGGEVLVGSTFDDGDDLTPDPDADLSNLRRLARATGGAVDDYLPHARSAASGFRFTTPDRLPLIGPVPDSAVIVAHAAAYARNDRLALPMSPGLFAAAAFGARGMLWSSLAAELLAAEIDGGPAPIETDLVEAIAPARFLRRRLRRLGG